MNLMTVFFLQAPAAGPDGSMMWIMHSHVRYHVFLYDSSAK